jgi:hypothetical protein
MVAAAAAAPWWWQLLQRRIQFLPPPTTTPLLLLLRVLLLMLLLVTTTVVSFQPQHQHQHHQHQQPQPHQHHNPRRRCWSLWPPSAATTTTKSTSSFLGDSDSAVVSNMQWALLLKHHVQPDKAAAVVVVDNVRNTNNNNNRTTVWKGIWTTYDDMGNVLLDSTVASVNYHYSMHETDTVAVSHTIVTNSVQSDCETCHDQVDAKTLAVATYQPFNLASKKVTLGACGMVIGPTVLARIGAGTYSQCLCVYARVYMCVCVWECRQKHWCL